MMVGRLSLAFIILSGGTGAFGVLCYLSYHAIGICFHRLVDLSLGLVIFLVARGVVSFPVTTRLSKSVFDLYTT